MLCPSLQLMNNISSDCQKLLIYFNGAAVVPFYRIELLSFATVFPNNLALNLKDLKVLVFAMISFKLAASSLE